MTKTIYIVSGNISDYDGSYSWNVKAFTDRERADIFAMLLNDELSSFLKLRKESYEKINRERTLLGNPTQQAKGESKKKFDERVGVWSLKCDVIHEKHKVTFKSQYDPEMSIDDDADYEVNELVLEE